MTYDKLRVGHILVQKYGKNRIWYMFEKSHVTSLDSYSEFYVGSRTTITQDVHFLPVELM